MMVHVRFIAFPLSAWRPPSPARVFARRTRGLVRHLNIVRILNFFAIELCEQLPVTPKRKLIISGLILLNPPDEHFKILVLSFHAWILVRFPRPGAAVPSAGFHARIEESKLRRMR
jgi:23S rRNA A2030 N6-methylase RlmJ